MEASFKSLFTIGGFYTNEVYPTTPLSGRSNPVRGYLQRAQRSHIARKLNRLQENSQDRYFTSTATNIRQKS
jgi:hypothetical protein